MSRLRYLLDEHVDPDVRTQLVRHEPDLVVWLIGDPGAPKRGTADQVILLWCEDNSFSAGDKQPGVNAHPYVGALGGAIQCPRRVQESAGHNGSRRLVSAAIGLPEALITGSRYLTGNA